jgi:predicted nucleic-acid-binding protein
LIGLDTNLLIGWLVEDAEAELPVEGPYFIGLVVLAEFAWVMRTAFSNTKSELLFALTQISSHPEFRFSDIKIVKAALEDYSVGAADFSDYLLLHDALAAGTLSVATKDKKAARHPKFQLVKSQ